MTDYEPTETISVSNPTDFHNQIENIVPDSDFTGVVVLESELKHMAFEGDVSDSSLTTLEDEFNTDFTKLRDP